MAKILGPRFQTGTPRLAVAALSVLVPNHLDLLNLQVIVAISVEILLTMDLLMVTGTFETTMLALRRSRNHRLDPKFTPQDFQTTIVRLDV